MYKKVIPLVICLIILIWIMCSYYIDDEDYDYLLHWGHNKKEVKSGKNKKSTEKV